MPIASKRGGVDERASLLAPELLPLFDDAFVRSCDLYEEYVFRLALDVFRRLELHTACVVPVTSAELIDRAGLDARVASVPLDWILRELASCGVLHVDGAGTDARYRISGDLPELDPDAVRTAQAQFDARALPTFAITALAAQHYPAVLRGDESGEHALFGASQMGAWADYFANENIIYAISNAIGAIACEAALPPRGGAILELGGGLGSGAATLLARLVATKRMADVSTYRFTEISLPFLRRAQKSLPALFPSAPLAFARLDMDQPFAEGGITASSFTLVHAVNALHVARDLAFTLGEIRTALAPDGVLVLAECIRPFPGKPVFVEFVFNLLEAFRSPVLVPAWRPNGGFLTPEQWTAALTANGFRDVRLVPDVAAIRDAYPSFVVAAIVAVSA